MLKQKEIKARVQHKHGTAEDWSKSSLVPLLGELIIYDKDSIHPYERFKIGDGSTNVNNLKFAAGSDLKAGANIAITSNTTDGSLSIAAVDIAVKPNTSANAPSIIEDNTIYTFSLSAATPIEVPVSGMIYGSILRVTNANYITWSGATHYNGEEPVSGEVWEFSVLNGSIIGVKLNESV